MPAAPTIAAMTASAAGSEATAEAPSAPQTISTLRFTRARSAGTSSGLRTETISGAYLSICCASRSRLPPAASPTTRSASGNASTTSSVERPTEPVEPRMEMFLILKTRNQKPETRNQKAEVSFFWFLVSSFWFSCRHDLEASEVMNDQEPVHVQNRRGVENRVEPVQEATVAGEQRAGVFHIRGALPHRFRQVSDHAGKRENHAGDDDVEKREVPEEREVDDDRGGDRRDHPADEPFHGLLRADARRKLVQA